MDLLLSALYRRRLQDLLRPWIFSTILILLGVFFFGVNIIGINNILPDLFSDKVAIAATKKEVFGFAPYWTLNKLDNIKWDVLTTFAYFSLPINSDGTIDRTSWEWQVFNNQTLSNLFETARSKNVRRVVTLTQMEAPTIREFLSNPNAWEQSAYETVDVVKNKNLDGVNIDIEYIPSDDYLRGRFSEFISVYSKILNENLNDPYITVSVLASSVKENKIYDIAHISRETDGVFMMAYDFYYRGSDSIGPSAPLYGHNGGSGPYWYDVSTAVNDFLSVAPAEKIIMGVPFYGWNYPTYSPEPKGERNSQIRAFATTNQKVSTSPLLATTPFGGWDDTAKVSWRGYWDENGWHVVYMEDTKSLSLKFDFAKQKNLAGVGIWALGFDSGDDSFWTLLSKEFETKQFALK